VAVVDGIERPTHHAEPASSRGNHDWPAYGRRRGVSRREGSTGSTAPWQRFSQEISPVQVAFSPESSYADRGAFNEEPR